MPRRPVFPPVWGEVMLGPTLGAVGRRRDEETVGGRGARGAGACSEGGVVVHRYVQQGGEGTGRWQVA